MYVTTSEKQLASIQRKSCNFTRPRSQHWQPPTTYIRPPLSPFYHQKRFYTYIDGDIVIRLNNEKERVGFSVSGGSDEDFDVIVNGVLPGIL
ncbi:unnamed protein product [Dracunculus medinensis]|uniref:Peptidase A1 domain-containing protein n=1 Tax=Dracunculus medinensis TaxID=318479 RepID=A0A158Q2K3_DRAME|nr:unnamed protein product [Dracunculus medinensis]